MRKIDRALAALLSASLLSTFISAADVIGPSPAASGARVVAVAGTGSLSFGPQFNTQLQSLSAGLSMASGEKLLTSISELRAGYAKEQTAEQRFLLAAITTDPAQLAQRLAQTDLPKAQIERLQKLSEHVAKAVQKDSAFAKEISAVQTAVAEAPKVGQAKSDEIAACAQAAVEAFLGNARKPEVVADASTQISGPQAAVAERILKSFSPNFKSLLSKRPTVSFGSATGLPVIGMPNIGDDFASLWTKTHAQSDALLIAAYNFDDMDMAKSIVAAIQGGKKVTFVGDYSNWFPIDKGGATGHGADPRTPAMKYLLANKNDNLQLYILKGLGGASGINHNKFSVFSRGQGAQLQELGQTGSFNYTKTSQNNHFENFGFTDDKDRIAFLKDYHAWLVRRAKPFHEGMTEAEAEPTFPANDPIPADKSRLTGIPFPKVVGTPKSEAGKWYVDFYEQAKQEVYGAMFAMFPTHEEVVAIEAKLAAGIPVNFIVDHGQVERAGALYGLMRKGMKLRVMAGPEKVIYGLTPDATHSKLHMKVVTIDGGKAAKGVDSLNDSNNAEAHNFENLGFWEGYVAQFLYTYIKEVMWPLASEPSQELVQKLEAEFNRSQVKASPDGGGAKPKPVKTASAGTAPDGKA